LTLDFDRANERALQIGVAYNFAGIDLPGLTFRASGTFGNGAINPATGAALSNDNEYDLDLIYQVSGKTVPDWARPLQLRARAGYTDRTLNGVTTSITDYRLILNYEIFLKKPR
jgi:hypothetical protein